MPIGMMDRVGNLVTTITKPDNVYAIWGAEGTCIVGRTRMAYKRGGGQEARERAIEETMGAITWLCAADWLNKLGDKALNFVLKNKGANFDVGCDIMRKPFDNFMMNQKNYPQGFSAKKISLLKGAKVISALVIANLFIGFCVPKCNQALSRMLNKKAKEKEQPEQNLVPMHNMSEQVPKPAVVGAPAFTSLAGLNAFTNIIENTNVGKLVGTDVGILGGRALSARRKEEALDVAVRDGGSLYFYYWARLHAANVMNLIETGGKHIDRLDPKAVNCVSAYLDDFLKAHGDSMDVEVFRKVMFGAASESMPENLVFEKEVPSKWSNFMARLGKKQKTPIEVIELDKFLEALSPEQKQKYETIAREMSALQPKRCGVSILSKNQIADIMQGGEVNSPKFLHKLFDSHTNGLYKNEYKYVSHRKLYEHKQLASVYIEDLIKASKDGKVDSKLLKSVKGKNLVFNGINFAVGFVYSAAFLSTFIPKIQYYITKKVFGHDGFPGSDEYGEKVAKKQFAMNIKA